MRLRPLHLSIGWPSGIAILLNHGAEVNVYDNQYLRPVDHAILRGCLTSVAFLEATNFSTLGLEVALYTGEQARSTGILDYLINIETDRRRNLQSLVSNFLPQSFILRFLAKDRLLDAYARDAVSALKQHNVSIPVSLSFDKSQRTVYHLTSLKRDAADCFWKAGFRDLNEPDCFGNTPLMKLDFRSHETYSHYYLELIDWFEGKGIKLDETVQHIHSLAFLSRDHHLARCSCLTSGHTVLHLLAHRVSMGLALRSFWSDRSLNCFLRILMNEKQDACKCACTLAGCRAVFIAAKIWSRNSWGFESRLPEKINSVRWPSRFWLFCFMDMVTSEEMILDVTRFLTFDTLGLTHTCCRPSYGSSKDLTPFEDEDEIQEIHDEEQEDLQLLEDLLLEFDDYRRKSNCTIQEFYLTYWRCRMKEVLSGEKTSNQDDFREIGVSLHASKKYRYTMVDLLDELVNDPTDDSTDDKITNLKGDDLIEIRKVLLDSENSERSEDSKDSRFFRAPRHLLSRLLLPTLFSPRSSLNSEKRKQKSINNPLFFLLDSNSFRLYLLHKAYIPFYGRFRVFVTKRGLVGGESAKRDPPQI